MENDKTARYRKMAVDCVEIAEQMTRLQDRAIVLEMAQRWLELAQQAEAKDDA